MALQQRPPLAFDPIREARRQWDERWTGGDTMATATALIRAHQIVMGEVERALEPFDLTFARYEALVLLCFSRKGRLPLGKMGTRLQVHPTSVTNAVDRLEAKGLVRRVQEPRDRRTVLAEITAEGRRLVEAATAAITPTGFGVSALDADELATLDRILTKLRLAAGDWEQ